MPGIDRASSLLSTGKGLLMNTVLDTARPKSRLRPSTRRGRGVTVALTVLLAAATVVTLAPSATAAEPTATQVSGDSFTRGDAAGWGKTGTGHVYSYKGQTDSFA